MENIVLSLVSSKLFFYEVKNCVLQSSISTGHIQDQLHGHQWSPINPIDILTPTVKTIFFIGFLSKSWLIKSQQ